MCQHNWVGLLHGQVSNTVFKGTHTHTHTDSSPTMECHFIAEGVVVTASTNQSTPSFDESQKQTLQCVCVYSTHRNTLTHACLHTLTQQQDPTVVCTVVGWHAERKWELWKLYWRDAASKTKCECVWVCVCWTGTWRSEGGREDRQRWGEKERRLIKGGESLGW